MANRGPQSTHWCFTVHEHRSIILDLPEGVQYLVYQEEMPESFQVHIQGYVQFERRTYRDSCVERLKQWFQAAAGPHVEKPRGSSDEASAYCQKEETRLSGPYEFGQMVPHAGARGGRSDLLAVKKKIDEGATMKRIAEEHFGDFVRHERAFRSYKRLIVEPRNEALEIYVVIGPSGCGKTRWVRETFPDAYWHPGGKWWDDYDGEKVIVFDEFYGHKMSFSQLLQVLDRYPLRVETKGGSAHCAATTFVFTSNQDPQDWYNAEKTHQGEWAENPLKRRLDEFGHIIYMGGFVRRVPQVIPPDNYVHAGFQIFGNNINQ